MAKIFLMACDGKHLNLTNSASSRVIYNEKKNQLWKSLEGIK